MRIAMIGTGYVGLVSGACFAEFGLDVVCVDKDQAKIDMLEAGKIPIYEPGLDALVAHHKEAGRLTFTTDLKAAVKGSDAVFIAVGTPTRRGDGHADLTYVFAAAEEIAEALDGPSLVVTKSTVPVGTGRRLQRLFKAKRPDLAIDVASNPEFLREGSAIEDFLRPDRVVCGVESERAKEILSQAYRPLNLIETPIMFTSLETAELVKYATNSFLATKITFINEMADLCEKVGADVQQVAKGMGLDGRIGRKFLHAGPGYGGSCFPKDTLALLRTGEQNDSPLRIVEAVVAVNEHRKRRMVKKIVDAMGGHVAGKTVGVLGVTFKPNTDDMRDSPSLVILPALRAEGARVRAFDPEGMNEAAKLLPEIEWCDGPYGPAEGADALVVLTEWNVFRGLDLGRLKKEMRTPLLIDLRNIFDAEQVAEAGFAYTGIGRASTAAAV
jgi:UDPglucose 6-dehydrogenase